jgi:hypothetical protein
MRRRTIYFAPVIMRLHRTFELAKNQKTDARICWHAGFYELPQSPNPNMNTLFLRLGCIDTQLTIISLR